jgi:hypothetical protein
VKRAQMLKVVELATSRGLAVSVGREMPDSGTELGWQAEVDLEGASLADLDALRDLRPAPKFATGRIIYGA